MADKPAKKKWIQKADIKAGAFTKKADAAGKSVPEFAAEKSGAPGKLGKEARLAQTFSKMRGKKALKYPNSGYKD